MSIVKFVRLRKGRAVALFAGMTLSATALITAPGTPAQADYTPFGMPSKVFNYQSTNVNSTWVEFFDTGNIRWDQRVGSRIGRGTATLSTATADDYDEDWLGAYVPKGATRENRYFEIKINVKQIKKEFGTKFGTMGIVAPYVITHELGHALSMTDNPRTTAASIMKYPGFGVLGPELPQPYDISEVARIY